MLPRHVADTLKNGTHFKPEKFQNCCFLFSDIVGFTRMSAASTPDAVISLLNQLFTYYDAIVQHYEGFKYETVGDCYVSCMFDDSEHIKDAVKCGKTMLKIALMAHEIPDHINVEKTSTMKGEDGVRFRCGLHIGAIVGGVIGNDRPKYNFAGDTINTAARMESTAKNGCTQITETLYELVEFDPTFTFEKQAGVQVKGKGMMMTYFVKSAEGKLLDPEILEKYNERLREKDAHLAKLQEESKDFSASLTSLESAGSSDGNIMERYFSKLGTNTSTNSTKVNDSNDSKA